MISPLQRPLPDNTQHSRQPNIRGPSGIRTRNHSKRPAPDRAVTGTAVFITECYKLGPLIAAHCQLIALVTKGNTKQSSASAGSGGIKRNATSRDPGECSAVRLQVVVTDCTAVTGMLSYQVVVTVLLSLVSYLTRYLHCSS